ncbi:hypothetical protein FDG2_3295 [Candidatus Protofrankia californiensis]|uniref:Uncharacterized protein n=1 Tax=Candidatus Protofrankia californiensis TaxID=1839754 RepID=A0A1C3NZA7_9ACTN|nr:hypothetical protein FDG2_3295 [Candidatus Protofrankia californiensis]
MSPPSGVDRRDRLGRRKPRRLRPGPRREVLDLAGKKKTAFTVEHSAAGFTEFARRLAGLGDPGLAPVALERPDGRLVDALLESGHPVVPVKPNAIKV